jgi:hypothetical protein
MKPTKLRISIIFFLGLCLLEIHAQQTTSASSGNATGSGGSVSYTLGQVVYYTNTAASGSVSQGIQQPFEIFVVTGFEEAKGISLQCLVYPNPVSDYLILKMDGDVKIQCIASLYDINGKLLEDKKMDGSETRIAMNNYVSAIYFLKVIQNGKEIKTFKIIKK